MGWRHLVCDFAQRRDHYGRKAACDRDTGCHNRANCGRRQPRPAAPAAGQPVSVAISNFAFAPKTLTVAPGTTVVWKNGDSAAHTVTADNDAFDSGNLDQGATFKFTFTQPGTYAYYCSYHGGPVDRAWPARSSSSKRPGGKLVCHEQAPTPEVWEPAHGSTAYNVRPAAVAW